MSDKVVQLADVKAGAKLAPEASRGLRAAATTPSSLRDDLTFDFVLATPAPVVRWYRDLDTYERFQAEEVLPVETAILMAESGRSIPILNSHQAWDVDCVIGVVTEMRVEDGKIVCKGRLSGRDSVKDVVEGVREGVLRNISVGYDILETELVTDQTTGKRTMRARRWLILEASLVPVPADGNAQIRSASDLVVDWRRSKQETDMTKEEIAALVAESVRAALAAQSTATPPSDAAAQAAVEGAGQRAVVPATPAAPATPATPVASQRSAEDTAAIALFRSQATAFGVEAAYDAYAASGATMAELRGVVTAGMNARSNPTEIVTGNAGGERSTGEEKLMRFNETATAKAEAAARAAR